MHSMLKVSKKVKCKSMLALKVALATRAFVEWQRVWYTLKRGKLL